MIQRTLELHGSFISSRPMSTEVGGVTSRRKSAFQAIKSTDRKYAPYISLDATINQERGTLSELPVAHLAPARCLQRVDE